MAAFTLNRSLGQKTLKELLKPHLFITNGAHEDGYQVMVKAHITIRVHDKNCLHFLIKYLKNTSSISASPKIADGTFLLEI
jgi:hypothetical protein